MRLATCILILVILLAMVWYAPHYLAYANKPVKSDVIVLFISQSFDARKREVLKLLEEGYASHIIVPAYGTTLKAPIANIPITNKPITNYPKYLEETHIEVLEAKKMMEKAGFQTAIFVSSPFHMRRIKIIAKRVFGDHYANITFVPTRYAKKQSGFWLFANYSKHVVSEYGKIVWFLGYATFST